MAFTIHKTGHYIHRSVHSQYWMALSHVGWQNELGFTSMLKHEDKWDGVLVWALKFFPLPPKVQSYSVKPPWPDFKHTSHPVAGYILFGTIIKSTQVKWQRVQPFFLTNPTTRLCDSHITKRTRDSNAHTHSYCEQIYRVAFTCTLSRQLPATKVLKIQYSGRFHSISSPWNESLLGAILFLQSTYSHSFNVITSFKE